MFVRAHGARGKRKLCCSRRIFFQPKPRCWAASISPSFSSMSANQRFVQRGPVFTTGRTMHSRSQLLLLWIYYAPSRFRWKVVWRSVRVCAMMQISSVNRRRSGGPLSIYALLFTYSYCSGEFSRIKKNRGRLNIGFREHKESSREFSLPDAGVVLIRSGYFRNKFLLEPEQGKLQSKFLVAW